MVGDRRQRLAVGLQACGCIARARIVPDALLTWPTAKHASRSVEWRIGVDHSDLRAQIPGKWIDVDGGVDFIDASHLVVVVCSQDQATGSTVVHELQGIVLNPGTFVCPG